MKDIRFLLKKVLLENVQMMFIKVRMMKKECNQLIWLKHMQYGTSKSLICKKEKSKRNNIKKQYENV